LRVDELAARHGFETRWQSMLLGVSVLKVMGMKPLRQYPLKGDYLKHDFLRYIRRHNIKTARDLDSAPANPLAAGRIFHIVDAYDTALAKTVAHQLLHAQQESGLGSLIQPRKSNKMQRNVLLDQSGEADGSSSTGCSVGSKGVYF
jgi:2-hydroxychromene-2-carboxylate isomerase